MLIRSKSYFNLVRTVALGLLCALPHISSAQNGLEAERRAKADAYFYRGVTEASNDRMEAALDLILYSYKLQPNDPEITLTLAKLYAENNKVLLATTYAEKAHHAEPNDKDGLLFLTRLYLSREQHDPAITITKQWLQRNGDDQDVLNMLGRLYYVSGAYTEAINTYTKLQKQPDITYEGHSLLTSVKAMLYKRMGKEEEALKVFEQQVHDWAEEPRARKALIETLYSMQRYSAALPHLNLLSTDRLPSVELHDLWIQYYLGTDNIDQVDQRLDGIRLDETLSNLEKLDLGKKITLGTSKDGVVPERYNRFFLYLIEQSPEEVDLRLAYSDVLSSQKAYTQAIEALLPIRATASTNPLLWEKLVGLAINLVDHEQLATYATEAYRHLPDHAEYAYYSAVSLHTLGQSTRAIGILEHALSAKEITQDHALSQLAGLLADIYLEQKQTKRAYEYYELALKYSEHNASVLNNYAYSLVESGIDLDKAEWLASRAMQINSEDVNLLDTYGWIFYKKGNLSLAKLYLRKAINLSVDEPSAILHDHLGDVFLAEGNKTEAASQWRKAMDIYTSELESVATEEQSPRTLKRLTELKKKLEKIND